MAELVQRIEKLEEDVSRLGALASRPDLHFIRAMLVRGISEEQHSQINECMFYLGGLAEGRFRAGEVDLTDPSPELAEWSRRAEPTVQCFREAFPLICGDIAGPAVADGHAKQYTKFWQEILKQH